MTKTEARNWIQKHGLTAENKRKSEVAFYLRMHAGKPNASNVAAMEKWKEKFCVEN